MEKDKSRKIKCKRKDCQYEWIYKGNQKFWATCPRCHNKVSLKKQEEENE